MPRLAADSIPWHFSAATVCVGQSEHSRRFEWELRSVATNVNLQPIPDHEKTNGFIALKAGSGRGTPGTNQAEASCNKTARPWPFTSLQTALRSLPSVALSSAEARDRLPSLSRGAQPAAPQHNSGRQTMSSILEHPPQGQVRVKTGASTRIGAAVFHFEWIDSGFTEVCFWTAPGVPLCGKILALEDWARFDCGLCPARLSPNRCLAGSPTHTRGSDCGRAAAPSCPTEN